MMNTTEEEPLKLKELYGDSPIPHPNDNLQIWYNEMLEKTAEELTLFDVTRDLLQGMFLDTTIPAALAYLMDDIAAGDYYEGNLLKQIARQDRSLLLRYKKTIQELLPTAYKVLDIREWDLEENREEFEQSIHTIEEKLR